MLEQKVFEQKQVVMVGGRRRAQAIEGVKHDLEVLVEAGVDVVQIALDRERSLRERFEQNCEVVSEAVHELGESRYERAKTSVAERAMSDPVRPTHETFATRYAGPIERVDGLRVYQRVGDELIAHLREALGEARAIELERAIGKSLEIGYDHDGP